MQLAAGDRLAQYEILAPLGAGGMGEVYRARDERLGRTVALKVLPGELATNAEAMRRFEQEARAASALNHPNIVTLYEIGHSENIAWMAMELIDGTDLRSTMVTERMTVKNALRIAVKLADGLAAAHDRRIVHRDLKPENVMITSDGFVKILDFGLAKQLRVTAPGDTTLPQTTPGTVFGTVGYMSPEQALGKETDHRTDQFAFGVMLYEMLTGVRPFDRPSKPETLVAIIRDEVSSPSQLAPGIPADIDRILARCLAKSPRDRYDSSRDLARDLRDARQLLTNESGRIGSDAPAARQPSRRMLAVGITLAAIVTVGSAVMWSRQPETRLAPTARSLAVMPFRDLSGTQDGRLLAEGISELVAAHLAEAQELRVTTVPADLEDLAAVRKRTGADAVIRGGVQRVGDRVRVTWSMVDTRDGERIDGKSVGGSATDLFALEDSVAASVLRVLRASAPQVSRHRAESELDPASQKTYVESFGIVGRPRDEKELDGAISALEGLLRNHRDSAPVNALLARALLNKSLLGSRPTLIEQAAVFARRAVTLDPANVQAITVLGIVQTAMGQHDQALATFNRALGSGKPQAAVYVGMADAFRMLGRGAEAERAYRRAIELKPDASGTFIKYGALLLTRGEADRAVPLLERAVELAPESAHSHMSLGSAYYMADRRAEAMRAYEASNAISPNASAFSNIGTIHFFDGRYAEACRAFERATELSPSDFLAWMNLGDAYRWTPSRAGEAPAAYARAIETAREAIRVNPRDVVAHAVIASAHAKRNELEEARREIRTALELDPTSPLVLYHAGVIALMEGRADSALSWLDRAISAGYPATDLIADPELRDIHPHPAFRAMLQKNPS